ncbi:MAG: FtsQ-type POTRA domain-containing protein [Actinomycetota bacterium]
MPLSRGRRWTAIAAAAVAAGLALYVSHSSLFHLRRLEVQGTSHLTRREVVELSGLVAQTNVLWLDTRSVERRLESDPWVAHASVSRVFPRTVRIEVIERAPVAVVGGYGGLRLIASDGTSLGVVSTSPHLPLIVVPPPWVADRGMPGLGAVTEAVAGLDPKLRSRVKTVVVGMDGHLVLHMTNGVGVEYGDVGQIAVKSRLIRSILRWASVHGRLLQTINVSAPQAPTASFAS